MVNGKMIGLVTASCMLLIACSATRALAQRGVGDATGMARRAEKPDIASLTGTIKEVQSGPCEMTTGRATIGTHVLLSDSREKTLNIHLGPQAAVAHVAEQLKVGESVTVAAFRTEKMSEGHYVAKSLTFDEQTVELRDENLRPAWAGGRGQRRGREASRSAMPGRGANAQGQGGNRGRGDRGRGYGGRRRPWSDVDGPGYGGRGAAGPGRGVPGNCPRWGGPPRGRGPGWAAPPAGPGRGYGRGRGAGRGAGRGPGRGFGPGWGGGRERGW